MIFLVCKTDGRVLDFGNYKDFDEAEEWLSSRSNDAFLVKLNRAMIKNICKMQMAEDER